ncbi:hypothetical protein [uncultured Amnibacterium sp.]|uniref:hypothetical protein n=1 Tax=uncultured Amnibacterium sp. TaxID=1631851 RepID=UPI0035CB1F5F
MDESERRLTAADPAPTVSAEVDRHARAAMRAVTARGRRRVTWRVAALSTVALLAIGGGAAAAAPLVRSIFDPQITAVDLRVESEGSATRCSVTFETSVKLRDVDEHQATMRAWSDFVAGRSWTVRVPHDATRLETLMLVSRAAERVLADFDRAYPGEDLTDAADVFSHEHCAVER